MTVRVFGSVIMGRDRPGRWARRCEPDAVLIEGPPEANDVLGLAASPAMRPPVALLGYVASRPTHSMFYPLASWSPEWVALRHGLARGFPVTMIDLPIAAFLERPSTVDSPVSQGGDADAPQDDGEHAPADRDKTATHEPSDGSSQVVRDPIARLAEAAGYDDAERWWEDMVEHRSGEEPWDAITEAMAALRDDRGPAAGHVADLEARREATMRQHIRAADRRHQRVAVVCGAWHAPALVERGPARADTALLSGTHREKAVATWVPWTNARLGFASGYGAGVVSPGWYEHLFLSPDRPVERLMVRVAACLRAENLDAAPLSVIDAVRLADGLATLRGRPLAGLSECTDAARAVIAGGHDTALSLVERRLVVGDAIGEIPPETPMVALAADLASQQRRLRLKPEPGPRPLELDLRKDIDLSRSRLLHRLDLLDIRWGRMTHAQRGTGTFREEWRLGWDPELSVRVIEASALGTTVESVAIARAVELASEADQVGAVTHLIESCLLAGLGDAVPAAMQALDRRAALTSDVGELMDALAPLARVLRYGTVRRTDVGALDRVVRGLVVRVCASVGPASVSLDDGAAVAMTERISSVSAALGSLDDRQMRTDWLGALAHLSTSTTLHGLVAGRSSRILLDAGP